MNSLPILILALLALVHIAAMRFTVYRKRVLRKRDKWRSVKRQLEALS